MSQPAPIDPTATLELLTLDVDPSLFPTHGAVLASGDLGWDEARAFEIVTADGRLRHVDQHHDQELFWALRGIAELHMDPAEPLPYVGEGMMLGDITSAAIDAFVEVAGPGSGSSLVSAEFRHLGGALGRAEAHHGALASLDASFLTFGIGTVFDEQTYRANHERIELLAAALAPYDTGRQYLNFTESPTDPARFYTPDAYRRLRAAKAKFDPENLFRANHSIAPAA
jgi:FAD/FMN-containing dehydrogenase